MAGTKGKRAAAEPPKKETASKKAKPSEASDGSTIAIEAWCSCRPICPANRRAAPRGSCVASLLQAASLA
jgi:hypothetical protein